jgi:hypothetical protein
MGQHKLLMLLMPLIALSGCGGGDLRAELEQLIGKARAKESEARVLAADAPCSEDAQCSVLVLRTVLCDTGTYQVYSLVSATARQAEAVAVEQREAADKAVAFAAQSFAPVACPLAMVMQPTPACSANRCLAKPFQ